MITVYVKQDVSTRGNEREKEYRGLSTDEKPTTVENGTTFVEIDTGKIYFYNKDDEQWEEV